SEITPSAFYINVVRYSNSCVGSCRQGHISERLIICLLPPAPVALRLKMRSKGLENENEFTKPLDDSSATFSLYRSLIIKSLISVLCDQAFSLCTGIALAMMLWATVLYCYHTRYFFIGTVDRMFGSQVFSIVRFRVLSFLRNAYIWYVSQSEQNRAGARLQTIKWEFIKEMYPAEFARFREQNLLNQLYQNNERKTDD
ncbi:hypothetical protein BOX15_Mlig033951g1, partial [Macrostomum lignano]